MPLTRFAYLFRKFHQKAATPEEAVEFDALAAMDEHAAELQLLLEETWAEADTTPVFTEAESDAMLQQVLRAGGEGAGVRVIAMETGVRRMRWWRPATAAAVVVLLGLGVWWWAHSPGAPAVPVAVNVSRSVAPVPGGNKAVLILGNGSTVTLDSTNNGLLATQGNTNVVKVRAGQLAYAGSAGAAVAVLYNTIRTPRGGQYQVRLPDGSRVWLNAATSLRFPTAFAGKDRTVELSGEAYFEIAPGKDRPFKVKVGQMTVDVLGTHFNVNAYDDEESFRTTLLSGAVRVEEGGAAKVLKPGEEALWGPDDRELRVAKADTDEAVAWKNGLFQFESAELKEVMRQVARWYDVEVHYEGSTEKHFSGFIARSASLADVLHQLERASKTSFTLEGRTVTVKPK